MQNPRRARAIAIAKAEDTAKWMRFRLLVISLGAVCALVALPILF